MNYEFTTDLTGRHSAHFDIEQQTFGPWFSDELGSNHRMINELSAALSAIRQKQRWEYQIQGCEYLLQLSPDGAQVIANSLSASDDDDRFDDSLNYYDCESAAGCGLDDFEQLLNAWCEFIGR